MNSPGNVLLAVLFISAFALMGVGRASAAVTVTGATGGSSISADTAGNASSPAWTTLGAISIAEGANGDFAADTNVTLVFKAPAGFEFNTGVIPDITFTASNDITSADVAMTDATTITLTLTVSGTTFADSLTLGGTTGIQVRPTTGSPLARGNHIYRPSTGGGTASIAGITASADGSDGSDFGNLTEVVGAPTTVQVETAADGSGTVVPAQSVVAGSSITAYAIARDAFGNFVDNLAADVGGWSLTNISGGVANGDLVPAGDLKSAVFTGHLVGSANILVKAGALTTTNSGLITVVPGAAKQLVIATPPSVTATAGVPFAQQPVILIEDQYGNLRSNDTLMVTATRSAGAGTLLGTTNVTAVGGVATFGDLAHSYATNITINFISGSLVNVESSTITVNSGAYSQLQLLMPGEVAAPGSGSGKTGVPVAQNTDQAFWVTVNAVDNYWNLVNTMSDTVGITASDPNAVLPAHAALSGGTQSFAVKFNTAGNRTVTATDMTDGSKTADTSPSITVNAGVFAKLQLLLPGETAAPGTPTGKTGTPLAQTAGVSCTVTVNAVDANWNLINTNDTVNLTSSDSQATMPANMALGGGTITLSATFKTSGSQTVTASDVTHTGIGSDISDTATINPAAASKLVIAPRASG